MLECEDDMIMFGGRQLDVALYFAKMSIKIPQEQEKINKRI